MKDISIVSFNVRQSVVDDGINSFIHRSGAMLEKFCKLGEKENAMLQAAFEKMGLTARAYSRIVKVSRTIADLDGKENIELAHIAEALQYRTLDRKYYNR